MSPLGEQGGYGGSNWYVWRPLPQSIQTAGTIVVRIGIVPESEVTVYGLIAPKAARLQRRFSH